MLAFVRAAPAGAQVTGSAAIDSDYRLRGYSLTDGQPAVSAEIGFDDPTGFYLSASGLAKLGGERTFLGVIGNVGYAKRLSSRFTIDAGLLRSQIRAAKANGTGFDYTEVYAGAYFGPLAGRLYYSPDYRSGSQSTLYGELEATVEPRTNWRVAGHLGLLTYLNSRLPYGSHTTYYDWRVSVARQIDRFEIHAAVQGRGPSAYGGYASGRKARLTIGTSFNF